MKKIKTLKKLLSLGLATVMLSCTGVTAFALDKTSEFLVKDQGEANTGWAFGAMSVLEAKSYRENGLRIDCSEEQIFVADVNMDGSANIKDATYIQMYISKYIDTLPIKEA